MGALLGLIPTIFPQIISLVNRVVPDPAQQAQIALELAKIQAEAQAQQSQAANAIFEEQAKVMQADSASESWLTRSARPIIALGFASMAGITFLFAIVDAMLGTHSVDVLAHAMAAIPDDIKNMILTLVGGWSCLRTAEKVTQTIVKK